MIKKGLQRVTDLKKSSHNHVIDKSYFKNMIFNTANESFMIFLLQA